jgi:G3E family GTPase
VDPEVLWAPRGPEAFKVDPFFPMLGGGFESSPDCRKIGFVTFSFESKAPFLEDCFRQVMTSLPIQVYRIKGYALFPHRRVFLNHVGGKTEWLDSLEEGQTSLAFVGWQVNEQEVADRLRCCLKE